jgi:hypothetical protein
MGRLRRTLAVWIGLLAAGPAAGDEVAVARAHLRGSGDAAIGSPVFFLPVEHPPGAVAVGAAHSFDRSELAEAGEVELRIGGDGRRVGLASRYYARPGRAYHRPGATLRDDFVVFALSQRPEGIRILEPAEQLPQVGDRVRILGIPAHGREPQTQLPGSVVRSEAARIEVDLDAPADLRGWGGAPVLEAEGDRVLGLLQSAWPAGDRVRTGVGPIGGVVDALSDPYEDGLGRLFATLAPPPSAATGHGVRRRAATGSPHGDQAPGKSAARVVAAAARSGATPDPLAPRTLRLQIEIPPQGAVVGDAAGVFVAGRAQALRGGREGEGAGEGQHRFDIVVAIDTSLSTSQPSGVDVDGDGVVGMPTPRAMRGVPEPGSTDPGDSILAAEVAAAAKLIRGLDPRTTRVGLVAFAGYPVALYPGRAGLARVQMAALTKEPLTSDYKRVERTLADVRERGARGDTHMAAGVDQSSLELLGLEGSLSRPDPESEKIILFFTDGTPTLPYLRSESGNVRAVLQSAQRARRAGIRIHSFAIGPEALSRPIAAVEMAAITDGVFTPVRDPGRLSRFIEGVSFAHIAEVTVRNASSGESAYQTRLHADGSWDALVPLEEGENQLEVRARSSDGDEAIRRVTVHHRPGAAGPAIAAELVPKLNELLEARLAGLRRERLEADRRLAEEMRRELTLEIERERAAALERAARQRKELELEIEVPDAP